MKPIIFLPLVVLILSVTQTHAQTQVVPKEWINAESLSEVQMPLQAQLDTGKSMVSTAWSMARVKDAELFVIYITVWEKLPAKEREVLFNEQEKWLSLRKKTVKDADDGKSGQVGRLEAASEHQRMSEARIEVLKGRLPKK
ncbi:hypothetical protein BH11VER1_BH11VER1_40660 [soil metagenome]